MMADYQTRKHASDINSQKEFSSIWLWLALPTFIPKEYFVSSFTKILFLIQECQFELYNLTDWSKGK